MGIRVANNLYEGRLPTRGFWSETEVIEEEILSILESYTGLTPIIRARFDFDGDGVYEVIEQDKILSVGNISRSIEYATNKARVGTAQIKLQNKDNRYSDNYSHSLTYDVNYHMSKVLIEIGFDWIHKEDEDYWIPLYTGYIVGKTENSQDKTVTIQLMDEQKKIFNYELAPVVDAETIINYVTASDTRQIQMGLYWGKHDLMRKDFKSKDRHLLIPCAANIEGTAYYELSGQQTANQYTLLIPQAINLDYIIADILDQDEKLWFWLWNDKDVADGGWSDAWDKVQQWAYMDNAYFEVTEDGFIHITDAGLNFKDIDGNTILSGVTFAEYFDRPATDALEVYDPAVGISVDAESNPVKALYTTLKDIVGIPADQFDASDSDPDNWLTIDVDFDHEDYHSWDVSSHYLDENEVYVCINADSTYSANKLIDDISEITRGSFIIGYGEKDGDGEPYDRIKFVINQCRPVVSEVNVLEESRIINPELSRNISEVRNYISVSNFDYDTDSNSIDDMQTRVASDSTSIDQYGIKRLEISRNTRSPVFLYNTAGFAYFLATHYLMLYKHPPYVLKFQTNLKGLNFDLKNFIKIKELASLQINYDDSNLSGYQELYQIDFNTVNFLFTFICHWAGYYLFPDGDNTKRWAFADNAWCDQGPNSEEYYVW